MSGRGDEIERLMVASLRRRAENNWEHVHSSSCIHNLPPVEQIELHGKTVDWWMKMIGSMPEQITPEQWEVPPIDVSGSSGHRDTGGAG